MNWYVLYTASRAEKKVEKQLIADGIEVFLPLHLSPRKWSDRVKMVEVPLFSSYIFVRTNRDTLHSLLALSGISRIVYYNGQPATIQEREIQNIRKFLEQAKCRECEFAEGDRVSIAAGPMKNLDGDVRKKTKGYLILYLESIGLLARVRIDQVLKAKASFKSPKVGVEK